MNRKNKKSSNTANVPYSISGTILRHLLEIASSRKRSEEVLQTFHDGRCWTESKLLPSSTSSDGCPSAADASAQTNFDCYWIILATNLMNRLLVLEDDDDGEKYNEKNTAILYYLVASSDLLTTILLSDKAKIERSSHQVSSRSILCRAILTSTMAALYGIRNYRYVLPKKKTKKLPKNLHEMYEVSLSTLDRLVHLRGYTITNTNNNQGDGKSGDDNIETIDTDRRQTIGSWSASVLEKKCSHVDDILDSSVNLENNCVKVLLEATGSVENENDFETEQLSPAKRIVRNRKVAKSSSKKRKLAGKSTASSTTSQSIDKPTASSSSTFNNLSIISAHIVDAFEKLLLSEAFGNRIDGRVAIKRWASIAIVWSQQGEGQLTLLREAHLLATEFAGMVPIQKSRLMSMLICIVSESGNQCGVRPPNGSIDQYLKSIATTSSSAYSVTGITQQNKVLRRADIRNWTTVVIYDYIENHKRCILQSDGEEKVESQTLFDANTDFADCMNNLCRSAASSSVPNSSYTQQSSWNKALLSISAAYCFELAADDVCCPDPRMINFALSHLVDCMRRLDPQCSMAGEAETYATGVSVSDQRQKDFENKFLLRKDLPKPIVPSSLTLPDKASDCGVGNENSIEFISSTDCNFGGLVENDIFTDEHAISLAIRAVRKYGEDQNSGVGKLFNFLTDLVRRIYNIRKSKREEIEDGGIFTKVETGKRKRCASNDDSSANRRGGRRRKTESGEIDATKNYLEWDPISSENASTATSALNAIRLCLTKTKRLSSCTIFQIIRNNITSEHIINLIKLGGMLDNILIKTKNMMYFTESNAISSIPESLDASTGSVQDFTSFENVLFSAHMNMCHVLGRGQTTYESNIGLDPVIWNPQRRKAAYEAIGTENKWSLSLPAAHHAFLLANMSCASIGDDTIPEKLIVTGYINSIKDVLGRLETLPQKKWGSDGRLLDNDILLSFNDARIFFLGLNNIPNTEKRLFFDVLVQSALNALTAISDDATKRSCVCQNTEASGFIARVLVICYSLINSISVGKEFHKAFLASVGNTQLRLPSFITSAGWYRQNSSFMGLFHSSWQSPSIPESIPKKRETELPKKSLRDFRLLIETAFSIGLESAVHDHCHLLFAAWNGIDQIPEDNSGSLASEAQYPTLTVSTKDYSKQILQLREDVCFIYKSNPGEKQMDLKRMVSCASELVESLLKNNIPVDTDMTQEISMPILVLLASLPAYISASVARHTKPGNDYFSTTLSKSSSRKDKRRGYSSESDIPESDSEDDEVDNYDDEVRNNAISRLREVCDAFGAGPIHPDYLDVSSSFYQGIDPSDSIEVAEKAINTLSLLIQVAFKQYKTHQSWAIKEVVDDQNNIDERANFCATLSGWSRHGIGPDKYPNRDWRNDVATVAKIPHQVVEILLGDMHDQDVEHAKSCWCPFAGQRLSGLLQSEGSLTGGWDISNNAELRAGQEWEVLLAEALTVSCLNSNQNKNNKMIPYNSIGSFSPEAKSNLAKAKLWRIILMNAVSNLLPATALLRLCLAKVGRSPHPFAFHENNDDPYDVAPLHFSEPLITGSHYTSFSLRSTIHEALTILARLSIETDEDSLSNTCHAVASHLIIDSNTFLELEGLYSLRCSFMGLAQMKNLVGSSPKKDVKTAISFLFERLLSLIEDSGKGDNVVSVDENGNSSLQKFRRLYSFLGESSSCLGDTLTSKSFDHFQILEFGQLKELFPNEVKPYKFSHKACKEKAVVQLVEILCEDRSSGRTRSRIALILSRVGIIESTSIAKSSAPKKSIIVSAMIKAFNKLNKKDVKSFLLKDLCGIRGSKSLSKTFRRDVGTLFCLLLFPQTNPKFKNAKFVHDTLMSAFDSWRKIDSRNRELILSVLLTYGSLFDSLLVIGTKLIESAARVSPEESTNGCELLSRYFSSMQSLQSALAKGSRFAPRSHHETVVTTSLSIEDVEVSSDFPKSCSFSHKRGFYCQHWYHCYTCNLVADRGCCTLCALVCHRDHDVAYSRHSSFFCDCAAEDGNPSIEQSRVSCKCLSSLSANQLHAINENERLGSHLSSNKNEKDNNDDANKLDSEFEDSISVEIAQHGFRDNALKSLNNFLVGIEDSEWLDTLFRVADKGFEVWRADHDDSIHLYTTKFGDAGFDSKPILRLSHEFFQKKLRERKYKELQFETEHDSEKVFVSVLAATGFRTKFSSDSHDALALARLSRNDISRSIMAIDSRGRMILAESSSLLFCCPLSAVNVSKAHKSDGDENLSRNQCIIGTALLGFAVVGMSLCPENEKHVVVWGTSEAYVLILKADYSGLEDKINLSFEMDDQDGNSDVLISCKWLPESQTHVAIGISRFVRLFDVCTVEMIGTKKRAHPVIGYNLGFEASLRDLSLVPQSSGNYQVDHISKMFLLLENGRLHSLDIKISNGKIESPSELHFEPSECVQIETEGIRARPSSSIGLRGSSTRTLGEGSKLQYLKQGRVLLYKCKASAVVALMLGAEGNVQGTFEFLPHTISSTVLGTDKSDGYSISGPYTLWTELGMVYRQDTVFFRVACVGRSTRSGSMKLICIEYNEKTTKVKEITWSAASSFGLGFHHGSFEGLQAFSAPVVQTNSSSQERYMTGERSYLCLLSSGGHLLIFGEDIVDMMPSSICPKGSFVPSYPLKLITTSTPSFTSSIAKFPLTIFEQLINVSQSDSLLFTGHELGIDSKELKKKLARDSSSSFVCPRKEGCCFSISLRNDEIVERSKSVLKSLDLVISAIRVLIGSSSDYKPSEISVQGRAIDIAPGVKRWYNIPLTEDEIARGVRTGSISLWVGRAFDTTNSPVLDSVEVYACERKTVERFTLRNYFASNPSPNLEGALLKRELQTQATSSTIDKSNLMLGVEAISNLCDLLGSSARVPENGKLLLQQLIKSTAINPEKQLGEGIQILCRALNFDSRSTFQDESALDGCKVALDGCKALLSDKIESGTFDTKFKAIFFCLKDCLDVSSKIAIERPSNYLQSMENSVKSSIATKSSKLILECLRKNTSSCCFEDLIKGTRGIIFLLLTELALVDRFLLRDTASSKDNFTQLNHIEDFFGAASQSSCEAIATFFNVESESRIHDLFIKMEAMKEVAYKCDSCGICPMKDVRYTIVEKDIDVCKECYAAGKAFAVNKNNNPSTEIVINEKLVSGLVCSDIKEMKPVSLENMEMDIEQVDVQEGSADEDTELRKALKLSLGERLTDNENAIDISADTRGYELFLGEIFSFIMKHLSYAFEEESSVESLVKLVLALINFSKRESTKMERATWFVREVSKGISNILLLQAEELSCSKVSTLVTCLCALSTLASPTSAEHFIPCSLPDGTNQYQMTRDERIKNVCDEHSIPFVKRKCDKGVNKDRQYYACGKEKGQRCNDFVWADAYQTDKDHTKLKSQFCGMIKNAMGVGSAISSNDTNVALFDKICALLDRELFGEDGCAYEISLCSSTTEKKSEDSLLKSLYSIQDMERDFYDGVFCSKEKLSDVVSGEALVKSEIAIAGTGTCQELSNMPVRSVGDRGGKILEAALNLLVNIADNETHGIARWFFILCEINMTKNKHASLAKKVLKVLCGGNRTTYHYVRDHYTFCFQLKKLYNFSHSMLEYALIVSEKTRQCSAHFQGPALAWSTLDAGALIGTNDLISEEAVSEKDKKCCGKALDELWSIIKNRGQSWRKFLGHTKLPSTHSHGHRQDKSAFILTNIAPMKVLFWIACSMTGIHQIKVLRLIDFALISGSSGDHNSNHEKDSANDKILGIGFAPSSPEKLLFRGKKKLSTDDLVALSFNMVYNGKTSELRRVAYHIVLKLSKILSDDDRWHLFESLLTYLEDIGSLGKAGAEFLILLQMLAQNLNSNESIGSIADVVCNSFINQLDAIKYDRSNGEWVVLESNIGNSSTRKRFDLSSCTFCLKPHHHQPGSRESASKISDRRQQTNPGRISSRSSSTRHSELITPFARTGLESLKENCTSNEFNMFYKLKYRISISDLHLSVSDPRGRYVKILSIYIISRPLASPLKSDQNLSKWEKVATINLSRGATRANATFSQPIVAANFRVEFTEFYERPGGDREGIYCPRCTRPVTNAHGVCVTCGEVAFQCRSCRHINYDRLDAFLCVECGYSCCGTFSWEFNFSIATNAIAITDDSVFDKCTKMYEISSSLQEGLKEKLREKLRSNGPLEKDALFDPAIQLALLGLLPPDVNGTCGKYSPNSELISSFDKQGSVVKYVAHPDCSNLGDNRGSPSNSDRAGRARNLLRLARTLRESPSSSEQRRSTDVIIRHLGRGISLDNIEDENELLEILDSESRPVNNAKNTEKNKKSEQSEDKDSNIDKYSNGKKNRKAEIEECQKILLSFREAGRESYELCRRLDAWKRLNSGQLNPTQPANCRSFSFTPSHCSVCGGTILLQLLNLWLKLFLVAPEKVIVTRLFFDILFQHDGPNQGGKSFQELKRQVIICIATKSRNGAEMVLRELRSRLIVSKDMNCAGILGEILEIDGFEMLDEFQKFAMSILSRPT